MIEDLDKRYTPVDARERVCRLCFGWNGSEVENLFQL